MEQKDYLLREIEKIGVLIRAMLQKLSLKNGHSAILLEKQIEDEKRMLLIDINFDMDWFLQLDAEATNEYISCFEGFNIENIELLAAWCFETGTQSEHSDSRKFLEKALQLYTLCNLKSKTYAFEREKKIKAIQEIL